MAWSKTANEATTYLDSGVVPVSGTNARSVVWRLKTSTTGYASNFYLWGWGTDTSGAVYRARLDHTNSYRLRLEINSGFATSTAGSLNDGNWHGLAISNAASSNINATTFYIDGSSSAIVASTANSINTGTGANLRVGYEPASNTAGPPCEYAEFAIYNRALDAGEMAALTAGHISPASLPRGRILYWPLVREYIDLNGLGAPTINGSNYTISAHPRVIYPSAQILQFPPTAAAAGFSPYWAAGSNVIMNNGSP